MAQEALTHAYITNNLDGTVSVIDTATNIVTAAIGVGSFPGHVAVSSDDTRIYVSDASDNAVSVIDTSTDTVIDTIPVGDGPSHLALTPTARASTSPTSMTTPCR